MNEYMCKNLNLISYLCFVPGVGAGSRFKGIKPAEILFYQSSSSSRLSFKICTLTRAWLWKLFRNDMVMRKTFFNPFSTGKKGDNSKNVYNRILQELKLKHKGGINPWKKNCSKELP